MKPPAFVYLLINIGNNVSTAEVTRPVSNAPFIPSATSAAFISQVGTFPNLLLPLKEIHLPISNSILMKTLNMFNFHAVFYAASSNSFYLNLEDY